MNTKGERVDYIRKQKGLSYSDLAEEIGGISGDAIRKAIQRDNLKDIYINIISDKLEINKNWILTGEGSMDNSEHLQLREPEALYNLDSKPKTGYYYPTIYAAAGLDNEMANDELERVPVSLPNWDNGIDFINVYGDSMYPKFCSGQIIGIKEVESQYINYGFAYVVILKDGQVLLKYIKKGSDTEHISLESENKFYEPKEYHLSQIKKVFIIKGVISKITM